MITVTVSSRIKAPREACFDLARSVDDHVESMSGTNERVVGGKLAGLLGLNDTMTLEARHFGLRFRLTAKITELDRPHMFVDEMVEGPFKSLHHVHEFEQVGSDTLINDTMKIEAPLGILGLIAERLFLRTKFERILKTRHAHIRQKLETKPSSLRS